MDQSEYDSVQPAYENGPKEINVRRGMPGGDKQFGKNKMPQDDNAIRNPKINGSYGRYKEHR